MTSANSGHSRLRQAFTPEYIAGQIRTLTRDTKCVVAVEGYDDRPCYGRIIYSDVNVARFFPCDGRPKLVSAFKILANDASIVGKYIGLVDKDYISVASQFANIFETDFVDLEAYCVWMRPVAITNIIVEYINSEKMSSSSLSLDDILKLAIDRAADLGAMRSYNDNNAELSICFDKFFFQKIDRFATLTSDQSINAIFRKISDLNNKLRTDESKHLAEIRRIRAAKTSQELVRGKDVAKAIVQILKSLNLDRDNPLPEMFEKQFRSNIDKDLLSNTSQIANVSSWALTSSIQLTQ